MQGKIIDSTNYKALKCDHKFKNKDPLVDGDFYISDIYTGDLYILSQTLI